MRSVIVRAFGEVSQLELVDVDEPRAAPGEVIVELAACGVNYSDLAQRAGDYIGGPTPPFVPGSEAAGTVRALGPGVSSPMVGARVIVIGRGGLQAERAAVPATSCIALPAALSFSEGAAFPVAFLTAYHALVTVARAAPGELVVIHAAAGGVGSAAVQIAKLLGLRVLATASTEAKRARVLALGADAVTGYDAFDAAARELGGAAVVLESVGGDIFRRSLASLAPLGRLVVFGVSSKQARPVDSVKLLFKSRAVLGLHLDAIFTRRDLLDSSLAWLLERVVSGSLLVQIGRTFPLAEVRAAHDWIASRQSHGKIVLVP